MVQEVELQQPGMVKYVQKYPFIYDGTSSLADLQYLLFLCILCWYILLFQGKICNIVSMIIHFYTCVHFGTLYAFTWGVHTTIMHINQDNYSSPFI